MAKWDTALGYELYLEGKSDGEIADACKVKISTVKAYRLNRWRKNPDGGRPPKGENAECKKEHVIANQSGDWCGDPVDFAGRFDGADPTIGEIATPVCALARNDVENLNGEEVTDVDEKEQKTDVQRMMDVIAEVTRDMSGIKAVCTGSILQALWNWNSLDDLREIRGIIDYLEGHGDCFG